MFLVYGTPPVKARQRATKAVAVEVAHQWRRGLVFAWFMSMSGGRWHLGGTDLASVQAEPRSASTNNIGAVSPRMNKKKQCPNNKLIPCSLVYFSEFCGGGVIFAVFDDFYASDFSAGERTG